MTILNPDFNTLRESLKTFLKGQSIFSDYNFDGSGLSLLIDVFCEKVSDLTFYTSMVSGEAHLVSAQLRDNVVAAVKTLGYVPRSVSSSRARLKAQFYPSTNPGFIVIPEGFKFAGVRDSISYYWNVPEDIYVTRNSSGEYISEEFDIVEGTLLTHKFTVDTSIPEQRFVLPNTNIDISTVKIFVQNSEIDTTRFRYFRIDDALTSKSEDKIFFIQETPGQMYEIYFGDDIAGKKPANNSIIQVTYVVSHGSDSNFVSVFTPQYKIDNHTANYSVISSAGGGDEIESIESIKLCAPPYHQAQRNLISTQDYEAIIKHQYSQVDSIRAWGGEENDPVDYGAIYISIKPKSGYVLSDSSKEFIKNTIIKPINIVGTEIIFVEPDYTYIQPTLNVKYNSHQTTASNTQVKLDIITEIVSYKNNSLSMFGGVFSGGKFVAQLIATSPSISDIDLTLELYKIITPQQYQKTTYTLEFNSELSTGDVANGVYTLSSTGFSYNGHTAYLTDDGKGTVSIYRLAGLQRIPMGNIGTINYTSGLVTINNLLINSSDAIYVHTIPKGEYLTSLRSQILTIDSADVTINLTNLT